MMDMVRLKNGAEEAEVLVKTVSISLNYLTKRDPIALYELIEKCKDRTHKCWGETEKILKDMSLLRGDNSVHDSIRSIVLSSIEGEGFDTSLVSPLRAESEDRNE